MPPDPSPPTALPRRPLGNLAADVMHVVFFLPVMAIILISVGIVAVALAMDDLIEDWTKGGRRP